MHAWHASRRRRMGTERSHVLSARVSDNIGRWCDGRGCDAFAQGQHTAFCHELPCDPRLLPRVVHLARSALAVGIVMATFAVPTGKEVEAVDVHHAEVAQKVRQHEQSRAWPRSHAVAGVQLGCHSALGEVDTMPHRGRHSRERLPANDRIRAVSVRPLWNGDEHRDLVTLVVRFEKRGRHVARHCPERQSTAHVRLKAEGLELVEAHDVWKVIDMRTKTMCQRRGTVADENDLARCDAG